MLGVQIPSVTPLQRQLFSIGRPPPEAGCGGVPWGFTLEILEINFHVFKSRQSPQILISLGIHIETALEY